MNITYVYEDVRDLPEAEEFRKNAHDLAKFAFERDNTYEQIYTALHKIVDLALYEVEIEIELPDENSI